MSEVERFRHLLTSPLGDRLVLLLTFTLTIAVDLTVAIEVGCRAGIDPVHASHGRRPCGCRVTRR
jgi:hypothetical protein